MGRLWRRAAALGGIAQVVCAVALVAQGSASGGGSAIDVCTLATDEEFQKAQGVHPQLGVLQLDPPVLTQMSWGPHCDYSDGSIDLFVGKSPAKSLEDLLTATQGGKQRVPVSGLGDRAFFTSVYPDDKYRNRGLLVMHVGPRILSVSMDVDDNETIESTKPKLEQLAKLVLSRYK